MEYNIARVFPGGPVAKNLHWNAADMGSIPGRGTKIIHAHTPQLQSLCAATKDPMYHN